MKRKPKTINFWYGKLPHWEVEDGRYFITVHVAGAIPQSARMQLRAAIERCRRMESVGHTSWLSTQRMIFGMMEKWLDQAAQNPWLEDLLMAEMVGEAIETRQRRGGWMIHSHIIMPNHLHMFAEIPNGRLKQTMEDFKRWTGHQATKIMKAPPKRFWQKEWFDHWSRSDEQDDRILKYIQNNPMKAGLGTKYRQSPYYFGPG